MKTHNFKIRITGSKIVGVAPISQLVGKEYIADYNPETNLFYFIEPSFGGLIGARRDEIEILRGDKSVCK